MEILLDDIIAGLDKSIDKIKQFNGKNFNSLIDHAQQTNEFIRNSLAEISVKDYSITQKIKIFFQRLFDWAKLLREALDKFEESDDIKEDGEILLTPEEMDAIRAQILERQSEIIKQLSKIIQEIGDFQNQLIKILNEIEANDKLVENAHGIIEDIRHRFNEANENMKILGELKEEELREKKLREKELRENGLRKKELREKELREKELREKELRQKELREKELREKELREKELGGKELREKELSEKELSEKELREKELREKQLREKEKINEKIKQKEQDEKEQQEYLNPENWNKFKYSLESRYFPTVLTVIIHAFKGTLKNKDDISVKVISEKSDKNLKINEHNSANVPQSTVFKNDLKCENEFLSATLRIEPFNLNSSFNTKAPWRISIPYAVLNDTKKEAAILCRNKIKGETFEQDTKDTLYEEGREEGIKYAEAPLLSENCYCVVVSRRKIEKFKIGKDGIKYESKVDDKVSISVAPISIMFNLDIQIIVQPIQSGLLDKTKFQTKSPVFCGIQSISPIVQIIPELNVNLQNPMSLQLPIPYLTGSNTITVRKFSAVPSVKEKSFKRSKTDLISGIQLDFKKSISEEQILTIKLVSYNEKMKMWKVQNDLNSLLNKNGDLITVNKTRLEKQKIAAVRCADDVTDDKIHKALDIMENSPESRSIIFIIVQHNKYPHTFTFLIVPLNKIEKCKKWTIEQNFNQETLSMSRVFEVFERDGFKILFSGNIISDMGSQINMTYNTYLYNKRDFSVQEVDRFAQQNLETYQGYISIIKETEISTENILFKTTISIPKNEYKKEKTFNTDFKFKPNDIIDENYLRFLSQEIGDDWKNLGHGLFLQEETIRRIANIPDIKLSDMAFLCLKNWITNTPTHLKRVNIMEKALRFTGRTELVNDLLFRSKNQ